MLDDSARLVAPPGRSPWTSFLLNATLAVLLCISALFAGIAVNAERAIEAELHTRAEALFNAVVLARNWNALHGGVLVEKRAGVESSPYLKDPDVRGDDGKVYTRRNPALMAREISELAEAQGAFGFHITSLKPVNPANAPDAFEARALAAFDRGDREAVGREVRGKLPIYRYVAPLYVEESCLSCHAAQGYRVGEVRGGISVTFGIADAERAIARNRVITVVLFLVTAVALSAVLWRLVTLLSRRLAAAEARIRELAVTDELTGLKNRRYVRERLADELSRAERYRQPLSCVLFDLDHFKQVNDTLGHDAGDALLQAVGAAALRTCRATDVVARYGGEEFLMLLPGTGAEGAHAIAARLREEIERVEVTHAGRSLRVTASFGVAEASAEDGIAEILKRADVAMYLAKDRGRNRVEVAA